NLEAMDAHGGWIASARDLVRLLVAVDGFSTKADLLSSSSISTMVAPSANNTNYAKGWSVNQFNNWWHTGALDGTASIWVRSSGGYTWAIILNKRIIDNQANSFWGDFDNLGWSCIGNASSFPSWDLLDFPDQNATNLDLQASGPGSVDLSWSNGNGASRIVIGREGAPVEAFPLDGTDYQANNSWGQGDDLGQQHFVVYNGTANNATVLGLDSTKTYHFRVFEYNQNTTTGQHALYQLARSPQESIDLSGATNLEDLAALGIRFFPNPAQDQLFVEFDHPQQIDRVEIVNLQGQRLMQVEISQQRQVIRLEGLSSGMYAISFSKRGHYLGSERFLKQ
ncbi:MAG: T9SS type A sorting domain-containing protein, partial [Bacteroidota bacterium]